MGETAANIVIENTPTLRRFQNSADCILNGLNESQRKCRITLGVVEGCLLVLLESFRVESITHRRTTSRTF